MPTEDGTFELIGRNYEARSTVDFCKRAGAIMDASGNGKPEYEMQKKEARPKKYKIDEDLFPQDLKKGMREDYLIKVLTYIRENRIEV